MTTREEFGKYLLLKKLAEDPLGETFRAGRLGQQGLDQVVLLRVLNGQGLDTERLAAGLEERKAVQSALKSPNIGSGVDVGRVRGVPYVSYDYISGKNLATLIVQAQQESSPFPTDHAMLISERIGLALAAAYEARHAGGRVHHGMVTPHLAMISNEGETRLLGFEAGPALVAQAGSLPPELLRYVAPELRMGGAPTGRSDVFSAGAVLFELLTGKALPVESPGGYDAVVAQARLAADGSPLPQGVAALLARSLAAPEARIADAPSWHKALAREMSEGGYNATTFNLAFFMHNLFRDEIERESREIEAEKTMEVGARGASVAPTGAETMRLPQQEVRRAVAAGAAASAAPPDDTASVQARYELTAEEGGAKSKTGLWIGIAALLLVAVGAGVYFGVIAPRAAERTPEPAETVATVPPVPEPEPQVPAGPTPEEIQAQIDSMFDEKAKAMEANLKSEYDERIAQMQRQLEDAQKAAAERAKRLEQAEREAEQARAEAATEDVEPAAEQMAALDPAAKTVPASNPPLSAVGSGALPAPKAGTGTEAAPVKPAPEPVAPPEPAPPQVKRGELVMAGPGVVSPSLVRRTTPDFPPLAARLNKEATVDVRVLVDENGKVIEAEIDGRKPGFGFADAALDAARSSTFDPPTKFGVPVRMWTTMRFVFKK